QQAGGVGGEVAGGVVDGGVPAAQVGVVGGDGPDLSPALPGTLADAEDGQARWHGERLLRPGEDDVDAPGVHLLGHARGGADAVEDGDRTRLAGDGGQAGDVG